VDLPCVLSQQDESVNVGFDKVIGGNDDFTHGKKCGLKIKCYYS